MVKGVNMSDKELKKWYIFNKNNDVLRWKNDYIQFDTKEQAERFLHSYVDTWYDSYEEYYKAMGIKIEECILEIDDEYKELNGFINLSNKVLSYEKEEFEIDGELVDVE